MSAPLQWDEPGRYGHTSDHFSARIAPDEVTPGRVFIYLHTPGGTGFAILSGVWSKAEAQRIAGLQVELLRPLFSPPPAPAQRALL